MANLHPTASWRRGQSGNPRGRPPKKCSLSEITNAYLDKRELNDDGKLVSRKQLLVEKLFSMAMEGNLGAAKLIFSYVDGLPRQKPDTAKEDDLSKLDEIALALKQVMRMDGGNGLNKVD